MSTIAQRSFASGEMAPALYARVDTSRYATGVRTMRNCSVLRSGGSQNRSGTVFVGEVKDSTKRIRKIPFIFNNDQNYVLEFGNLYMRVIKNGSLIKLTAQNITGISIANPCVVTYSGSDTYANGDVVYISGIVGSIGAFLNNREFKVSSVNTGTNTFTLQYMDATNVDSSAMGAYTSGGTLEEIYTVVTPYIEADLPLLKFSQDAGVLTIVHKSYPVREVTRVSDSSWNFDVAVLRDGVNAGIDSLTITSSGTVTYYTVTGVDEFNQESPILIFPASNYGSSLTPSSSTPITLGWALKSGSTAPFLYVIYKSTSGLYGTYGFIGTTDGSAGTGFVDTGIIPDYTINPPIDLNVFESTDNYPGVVGHTQQRRVLASTNTEPKTIYASKTGAYSYFYKTTPINDDDRIVFSPVSVAEVRHVIELGSPIVFTDRSEIELQGDGGVITPGAINPKTRSQNGASDLRPLIVDSTAIFVQARGSAVRDLNFDYQVDGYRGNDLTITASHLVDGFEIVDWAYQQIPHSIIWAVRDDGILLSLTYVRDQQIIAWARHDFDGGFVENVCVVPEGNEDAVYLTIQRIVDGRTVRYIERMSQRRVDQRNEMIFMDSALTYDGRNDTATTMTLSGGTTWSYDETITLTASASYFTASQVGNEVHIESADGSEVLRCEITAYSSATVVSVRPKRTVPVAMRSVALSVWALAVDEVSGLWHLEGKEVSVIGDGFVIASPYNSSYNSLTVTNGALTLDKCYSVIHVGLPYISDLETLDVDTAEGETIADKKILVTKVTVHLDKSQGLFIGREAPAGDNALEGLTELKVRSDESYDSPTDLVTGKAEVNIESTWNSNGRIFIRQVDPLPMSVLAVAPAGLYPFGR